MIFPKEEGKCTETAEENVKFWGEMVKVGKFSTESDKFSEIGGSETGGNASLPQGGWTPLLNAVLLPAIAHLCGRASILSSLYDSSWRSSCGCSLS